MKKRLLSVGVLLFVAGFIVISCQTPSQKLEDAKEKIVDAKEKLNTAKNDSLAALVKMVYAEEWKTFKAQSELKIGNNKIRIDELKIKMKTTDKVTSDFFAKKIDSLQQRNAGLKTRMYNYETGKTNWETFKAEFTHDMDGLSNALKEFTVNNKK